MWYVIQTETGQEKTAKKLIEAIVPGELYSDCRIIWYETKRKYLGEWHVEKKMMFPGYLFIIADEENIVQIFFKLKRVPKLTKLIRQDATMIPLYPHEEALLTHLSGEDGNVDFSIGIKEGDTVKIVSGCLKGLESRIIRIDRHRRRAKIEIPILGSNREVEVGLEIIAKTPGNPQAYKQAEKKDN